MTDTDRIRVLEAALLDALTRLERAEAMVEVLARERADAILLREAHIPAPRLLREMVR